MREGSLEAPDRKPLGWEQPEFFDRQSLYQELERVFDICHGCRRCVSLCDSFPTLFDLVDKSPTLEVDGVAKSDYMKVVEQCFLCDLCAETKCPYLPPHEWAVDFPHLMLRAKAFRYRAGDTKWRDRIITSTDPVFDLLSAPGIRSIANAAASSKTIRHLVGIHEDAPVPRFQRPLTAAPATRSSVAKVTPTDRTTGRVAIYVTCYGDHNEPAIVADLRAVLEHNGVEVRLLADARCCGMPKLELGDLAKVAKLKDANLPVFLGAIGDGFDIVAPIPSCVLMYKQELPLMFPGDADVARVKAAFFDPFEYLILRHKAGLVRTEFESSLGKVAYHVACHQRVQNIGAKTREFLSLVPGTQVTAIERCSGHDGTYALKAETHAKAMKIVRPVVNRVREAEADHFGSDCPMAGRLIQHGLGSGEAQHPISMVRKAYGI
jgi:glycerol-3-phosphate dehydrogenase subunit C